MLIGTFADLDYPPDLVARLNDHIDTIFRLGEDRGRAPSG